MSGECIDDQLKQFDHCGFLSKEISNCDRVTSCFDGWCKERFGMFKVVNIFEGLYVNYVNLAGRGGGVKF